jgi:hypothetical protein
MIPSSEVASPPSYSDVLYSAILRKLQGPVFNKQWENRWLYRRAWGAYRTTTDIQRYSRQKTGIFQSYTKPPLQTERINSHSTAINTYFQSVHEGSTWKITIQTNFKSSFENFFFNAAPFPFSFARTRTHLTILEQLNPYTVFPKSFLSQKWKRKTRLWMY